MCFQSLYDIVICVRNKIEFAFRLQTKISLDDDEIIENKKTGFYDLMREVKLR